MKTRVIQIDPKKLRLLEVNARYMRHETFVRLTANVQRDAVLTQIPFGALWQVYADGDEVQLDDQGDPIYEVLSGNHRIEAAIAAGLDVVDIQVTDEPLSLSQRRAIQLSHNEVVGEDDPATLKVLYGEIIEVDWKVYSGFDDKRLELLEAVQVGSLSEANLTFQTVSMAFLPDELEEAGEAWDQAKKAAAGSKQIWLARWAEYDQAMDAMEAASESYGIRNTSTALLLVLRVFERHITDLAEGYIDGDGQAKKGHDTVPLATVLGDHNVPAKLAAAMGKQIDRMLGAEEIQPTERWKALEMWLDAYVAD